jgi:hypothetical protein
MMRSCSRALGRQDSHPSLPLAACEADLRWTFRGQLAMEEADQNVASTLESTMDMLWP